jgi:hypothetical protein
MHLSLSPLITQLVISLSSPAPISLFLPPTFTTYFPPFPPPPPLLFPLSFFAFFFSLSLPLSFCPRFRVWGLGFRVLWFLVEHLGFRVQGFPLLLRALSLPPPPPPPSLFHQRVSPSITQ